MRKGLNTTSKGLKNRGLVDGLVDAVAINRLIMQYIKANYLELGEIEDITVTVADIQGSSEDQAAEDHGTISAAKNVS